MNLGCKKMLKLQKFLNSYFFWILIFFYKFTSHLKKMGFRFWLFWVKFENLIQKCNIRIQSVLWFNLVENLTYYLDEFFFVRDFFIFKWLLAHSLTVGRFIAKTFRYIRIDRSSKHKFFKKPFVQNKVRIKKFIKKDGSKA